MILQIGVPVNLLSLIAYNPRSHERATAKRLSSVLGMLSSLEVKVLRPT